MGFLSNLANSTPIVGTFKGVYHYARGEKEKGHEAMYASTRSSAVIAGGIFGGPAGAMAAGMATDAAASGLMKEEKGIVNSCKNIGHDIAFNRNPTRSIASAGLQLGLDGISGYGGGGSSSAVSNTSEIVVGKTMQRGLEQGIQKSVSISSAEVAKMAARKSAESVAVTTAERAVLISTHVGITAAKRTGDTEREEREIKWREQKQREREWREREQRERECREREQRERVWREQIEIECREREQREREWREREQREREWREQKQREREWREQKQREREWREREQRESVRRLRELRERLRREREWRERELRERLLREREWREQEQREREQGEREQQMSKKQEECKKREQGANSEKQMRDNSGSNAGSPQPPQGNKDNKDNKDNNKNRTKNNEPSFFETFMTVLRRILKMVYGNESEPFTMMFEKLPKEERKYLSKVLKPLVDSGTLEVVLELVIRMFKQHFHGNISYLTFISLLEFVETYVSEELLERTLISSGTETAETKIKPKERRAKIISEIASEKDIVEKLIELFKTIQTEIEAETAAWNPVFPNFRDIFAAVYHYFKHRRAPADGRILSVKEYYDWIRKFLRELEQSQKLTDLKSSEDPFYIHENFEPTIHRRFRIILKIRDGNIVLKSAYVVTMMHPDDEIDEEKNNAIVIAAEAYGLWAEVLVVVFMAIGLLYLLKRE